MLAKLSKRSSVRRCAVRPSVRRCAATGAVGLALLGTGLTATGRAGSDLDRF